MKTPVAKKSEPHDLASHRVRIVAGDADLARDSSFWGMAATQFLGAFNDNLFKQMMLLLATPTAVQLAAGDADDRQSLAVGVFAAAFLLFSGYAGFVSDRVSKRPVIVWSKGAEIAAMLLGMIGFL